MISLDQYFGTKPHTDAQEAAAADLLDRVDALIDDAEKDGFQRRLDPDTGSEISGSKGGSGDGGFRTPDSKTGAPNSSHKQAMAVDIYDMTNWLDDWLTDEKLTEHGLYREHPDDTPGWCHLTTRAPKSGRRTFKP